MSDRLIRVDMTDQRVAIVDFPERWKLLGGRALTARVLAEECDPGCDPLGPDNVLVFAPGVLAGTAAPSSGRISVGAKSPLTGGIKEANTGGNPGQHLGKLGYRAIIVTGQPADPDKRYGLEVSAEGAKLVERNDLKGLRNYPTCEKLREAYPETASFISCGPAGELRLKGASVATTDQDARHPARHAARGGLGAVMGSKGLKFVAIDPGKARTRRPADARKFNELAKSLTKRYKDGPKMFEKGTSSIVPMANMLNTFPYKNRTEGQSPDVDNLDGARIVESFATRGGRMHNCLTGCVVKCSNVVHDADGNYKTSGLEFETLTLLGSNLAMKSWEHVAELDRLCDDLGLDTIETGAAIGILMDAGRMEWGDIDAVRALIPQAIDGSDVGRAIGNGAAATGALTGHHRVPIVKGQAVPAWDPRSLKATGVTYATSPMGADHTAGLVTNFALEEAEFARASQEIQMIMAACDSSGFCMFISPTLDELREFYGAFFGEEISREQIADYAWQILADEWAFNQKAGFTAADDALPKCLREDPIGPNQVVFDVSPKVIADTKVRKETREELFTAQPAG